MSACRSPFPRDLHAQFVAAPETRAAVQSRLLSRGVRREDVEDETQNVLAKLHEADPTPTLEDCIALQAPVIFHVPTRLPPQAAGTRPQWALLLLLLLLHAAREQASPAVSPHGSAALC